ncbi:TLC domain-containing protein [Pelagophyceae sp. CCMP2097]|nr:TLC domain-containing protein [Pelagophyceae sp. CCMP2097]
MIPPSVLAEVHPVYLGSLLACAAWQVLYLFLWSPLGSRLCLPSSVKVDGAMWRIKLVNALHAALAGPAATLVLLLERESRTRLGAAVGLDGGYLAANALYGAETDITSKIVAMSVGFFMWDLLHFAQWERRDAIMLGHHVVSITVWPLSMVSRYAAWFVLVNIASEVSSPLLQARWFARTVYGKDSKEFALVSTTFAATFFLFRSTLIAPVFYAYFACAPWAPAMACGGRCATVAERIVSAVSIPIPQLLNLVWTLEIANAVRRQLRPSKGGKRAAKSE